MLFWGKAFGWPKVDQNLFMNDNYTAWDNCLSEDGFKGRGFTYLKFTAKF